MAGAPRFVITSLLTAAVMTGALLAGSAQPPDSRPLEPIRDSGQSVTGAFEGWYTNPDGSFSLLLGYFNRNAKQTLEIPVGPNNRIEPGGPDQGQPTYFLPRRQWGVFTITLPKDFGDKKLTWTIVANGQTTAIPLSLNPLWYIEPMRHAMGNTPPKLKFAEDGREQQGPPRGVSATYSATVDQPLTLDAWATDDLLTSEGQFQGARGTPPGGAGRAGPETSSAGRGDTTGGDAARGRGATGDAQGRGRGAAAGRGPGAALLTLNWSKYRGPGDVTFSQPRPSIDRTTNKATTTATFTAPGEYVLRLQANDSSGEGGGGFQCCWTNAHVRVAVK
jgi:hypothetical protein